ncbi:MAG: glycosyltransferase family 39 protein [Bacteroidota bacterium]
MLIGGIRGYSIMKYCIINSVIVLLPFAQKFSGLKKYFSQNHWLIFLVLLLLPLFYINVKNSHDWGDDFAQYFIQARNIIEHRPQTDNGLVFDRQTGEYALQSYPVGFPLILAAGWMCFGDSVLVSTIIISIFLVAFGIVVCLYFRKYFNDAVSVLLTLLIIYNPFTISFKKEVLTDIPFSFFLMLGVLLYQSQQKKTGKYILTGIVWGFALSVRGIGATLFIAAGFLLLQNGFKFIMKRENNADLFSGIKKSGIIVLVALGIYLLLNSVLFPVPSGGILKFYGDAIRDENFGKWLLLNLDYYYEVFLNFFANMGGNYQWISDITKFTLLALIPVGILLSWFRKINFDDWLFMAYILVLFVYPYLGGGFRFLFPIMPFLLKYIFNALYIAMNRIHLKPSGPAVIFLLVVILQYTPGLIDQVKSMDAPEQGPQEQPAVEAFEYINNLPGDDVVVFLKPRALSFYAGRKAAYVTRNIQPDALKGLFGRLNAHYFLICNENEEVNDMMLKNFIAVHKDDIKLLWQNSFFELYTDLK